MPKKNKSGYQATVFESTWGEKSLDYSASEPQFQNVRDWSGLFTTKDRTVVWTNREDFAKVVKRLYFDCPVSRRCIDIRAEKVASVPIVLEAGSEQSQRLLESPNVIDGTLRQFLKVGETSLSLGGDGWQFLDRRIRSFPQLSWMRQDFMVQDPKRGLITYDPGLQNGKSTPQYRFHMEDGICVKAEAMENGRWTEIDATIFHIMEHNPLSAATGSGAGDAILKAVDTWVAANTLINARFSSGGRKNGFIRAGNIQTAEDIAKFKEMVSQLNASKDIGVLVDQADWVSNQLTFTELDVVNIIEQQTRTISNGFAVPAVMLNLPGESNFANVRGADRVYYTGWVKPRALWLMEQLEAHLRRELDPSIKLKIDETQLPYLKDDQLEQAKALATLGCFTVNEVRSVLGYEPVADGDQLLKPAASANPPAKNPDEPEEPAAKPREVDFNADTSRRPSEKRTAK